MRVAFYSRERWNMEPTEALIRTSHDVIVIYPEDKKNKITNYDKIPKVLILSGFSLY